MGALNSFYFPHLSSFFTQTIYNVCSLTVITRQLFLFHDFLICFYTFFWTRSGSSLHTHAPPNSIVFVLLFVFLLQLQSGFFCFFARFCRSFDWPLPDHYFTERIHFVVFIYFNCNFVQPFIYLLLVLVLFLKSFLCKTRQGQPGYAYQCGIFLWFKTGSQEETQSMYTMYFLLCFVLYASNKILMMILKKKSCNGWNNNNNKFINSSVWIQMDSWTRCVLKSNEKYRHDSFD